MATASKPKVGAQADNKRFLVSDAATRELLETLRQRFETDRARHPSLACILVHCGADERQHIHDRPWEARTLRDFSRRQPNRSVLETPFIAFDVHARFGTSSSRVLYFNHQPGTDIRDAFSLLSRQVGDAIKSVNSLKEVFPSLKQDARQRSSELSWLWLLFDLAISGTNSVVHSRRKLHDVEHGLLDYDVGVFSYVAGHRDTAPEHRGLFAEWAKSPPERYNAKLDDLFGVSALAISHLLGMEATDSEAPEGESTAEKYERWRAGYEAAKASCARLTKAAYADQIGATPDQLRKGISLANQARGAASARPRRKKPK